MTHGLGDHTDTIWRLFGQGLGNGGGIGRVVWQSGVSDAGDFNFVKAG